jgi:SAM-dependent methyltransferase
MNEQNFQEIVKIMQCPQCSSTKLSFQDSSVVCELCSIQYPVLNNQLDMRLQKPKRYVLDFVIGEEPDNSFQYTLLKENPNSKIVMNGLGIPHHLTKELISYFPLPKESNSCVLDLGCGSTVHREICEYIGYRYIGLDYSHPKAPILGDAHSLPFADHSIDFILSIAVLEHIKNPFVMMKEAHRVLKNGGMMIGTVAFLEPYHANSYYHHSHLGTFNSLSTAGFKVSLIAPSTSWTVLIAQSKVLFSKLPRPFSKFLVLPLDYLHKLYWFLLRTILPKSKYTEKYRAIVTTGAFSFIATK